MARRTRDRDWIDPRSVTHAQIRAVEEAYWSLLERTRHRADMSRKHTTGGLEIRLPQEVVDAVDDVDAYVVDLPHKYTEPMSIKQALGKKPPRVVREPAGIGPRALDTATKVEQACEAVMARRDGGYPWADTVDLALMEGPSALIAMPCEAAFDAPQLMDDKGSLRDEYKGESLGEASDAYASDLERWYRKHPIVQYRPISVLDSAPILGPGQRLEGLLVRTVYTESELFKLGFRWDRTARGLMTPLGSPDAVGGQSGTGGGTLPTGAPGATRVLYELWGYHADSGCPYVAYSVQGAPTTLRDDDGEGKAAVLNLKKRYGLERLPVSWEWGAGWFTTNPDLRSMPYPAPFIQGHRSVEMALTCSLIHQARFGLSGMIEQIDNPDLARVVLEKNVPIDLPTRPMQVARVFGRVVPNVPPPGGQGLQEMAAFIMGMQESQANAEVGGNGDASGFAQTVARSFALNAHEQVRESCRRHYEAAASFTLEILSGMAERYDRPIPLVGNYRVPVSKGPGEQSSTRDVLEFGAGLCGEDYEVRAEFADEFGENLAKQQQAAEFVDRKLKPRRWFHELTGETAPEVVEAEILSDQMLMTEQGLSDVFALVARIQGDQDKAAALDLQASGQAGPDGVPSDLLAGLDGMQPPEQMGGAPPALTGSGTSTAQSSLAGAIGGAQMSGPSANAARAGVPVPGVGV